MQDDFILKGGLTADELPEGRAIYDTNDKFNPTGKDLVNATSWLPGPTGAIAGGADVWNSARDANVNPVTAGALALGTAGLGLFGGNLISKFLPKGKMAGYLRIGGKPGEIISDTGKTYNLGKDANLQDIINDANAYQDYFKRIHPDDLEELIDEGQVGTWLAGDTTGLFADDIDEKIYNTLTNRRNLKKIPDRYIEGMDDIARNAYNASPDFEEKSLYNHFSEKPLKEIKRGYTGIQHGDNVAGGPTAGVYMTDEKTFLKSPYMKYQNTIEGPNDKYFINGDRPYTELPEDVLDTFKKVDKSDLFNGGVEDNATALDLVRELKNDYPYLPQVLRSQGYAGVRNTHPSFYGVRHPFYEYLGFRPEDYTILNNIKIPRGLLE